MRDDSANFHTYLVGGAVRDRLLGRAVVDRDYVVVGAAQQDLLERGFKPVGKDFPVFLHPRTGEEYALARTERKSGRGYHGFEFHAAPDVTLEDDLRRRDFTINAIAEDERGALIDPFGGARDIDARILRHVSDAFVEDPVRVLRAARFMARFSPLGFRIAEETLALMRTMVDDGEVDHLVPERVWQELRRALVEPKPSAFLRTLRDCGALARILPEVDALYGVPQRAEFHPEVDTGAHIELVVDMAARLAPGDDVIGFAALAHDLGKALTPKDEWPRHIGHEHNGLAPVHAVCERLRVSAEHRDLALIACREHLKVHQLEQLRPQTIHDLIAACDGFRKPERIERLATVCECDKRGRAGRSEDDYPQGRRLRLAFEAARKVQARDLLREGMTGEAIGQALRAARVHAIGKALAEFRG